MNRREELRANLDEVRARIAAACAKADRDPAEVTLLAVTKTFPAADVALLSELGLREFAENKDQEAARKTAELTDLPEGTRWHMVGRLQRNKAKSVVGWADQVDSVDSARLADALAGAAAKAGRGPVDVLIQVSIDGDPARGGCPLDELPALADHVARSGELALRGVMAVAPRQMYPGEAFALLNRAVTRLRDDHPAATVLSAGMSGDLEDAIAWGSTCVRVGTALLGERRLASP
ncbi:YggS family pyridoxal phosphate-dependent enzyme [Saccharothrix coeruleofusca]|uniref:Pyridoxal phosphate homeostasis protein n=1 Tax=Saccharothrix coeruleofusca TaxID=33919 RepID=A0A918AKI4_9PSEU|nr:YggS family pyridoxal phosphate-dependent enzyme [Saccharothrix coeruleofusca]MBP2338352.1 pyridoxal phosphate enzyme (YggS family) [Saccharothrix coeruleofusca]GGP48941.1 YggS family pyridoxal phosphate enzyme [Saccharothrix coeruleofusca]